MMTDPDLYDFMQVRKHLDETDDDHDQKSHGKKGAGGGAGGMWSKFTSEIERDGNLQWQEVAAFAGGIAVAGLTGKIARRLSPAMLQHRADFFQSNRGAPFSSKLQDSWRDPMTTGKLDVDAPILDDIADIFDGRHTGRDGSMFDAHVTEVKTIETSPGKFDVVVRGALNPAREGGFKRNGWFYDDIWDEMSGIDNVSRSEQLGDFTITFSRNGTIHHDVIDLKPELQANGLSESFMASVLPKYAEKGWSRTTFLANLEVGGYAWAKSGFFEFADIRTPFQVRRSLIESSISQAGGVRNVPTKFWRELFDARTPQQLSQVGKTNMSWKQRLPNGRVIDMWPGKNVMLNTHWDAAMSFQ